MRCWRREGNSKSVMPSHHQLTIGPAPLPSGEHRAKPAKVTVPKRETDAFYAALGGCMDEVRRTFDLTLEGFAFELGTDRAQVGRQIDGKERPQLEKVFAVERFRGPLVIALARITPEIDVQTVMTVSRKSA